MGHQWKRMKRKKKKEQPVPRCEESAFNKQNLTRIVDNIPLNVSHITDVQEETAFAHCEVSAFIIKLR